jgi:flagellar biosynthesis anti-sigma factor FlgM
MNINNTVQASVVPKNQQLKKPVGHEAPAAQTDVKQSNEAFNVQIMSVAGQAHQPLKTDEIIHDKVAAIREQLAAGTYRISGKDVANKILGALKG